jgi:hypothetical protein
MHTGCYCCLLLCTALCCFVLQEVLKGDSYNASIAWLPADPTADNSSSTPASKALRPGPGPLIGFSRSSGSNGSGSKQPLTGHSLVIDSTALQDADAVSSSAVSSSGPGQLPVSSGRLASVSVAQPDRYPAPALSLQDFPQQGRSSTAAMRF